MSLLALAERFVDAIETLAKNSGSLIKSIDKNTEAALNQLGFRQALAGETEAPPEKEKTEKTEKTEKAEKAAPAEKPKTRAVVKTTPKVLPDPEPEEEEEEPVEEEEEEEGGLISDDDKAEILDAVQAYWAAADAAGMKKAVSKEHVESVKALFEVAKFSELKSTDKDKFLKAIKKLPTK